MLSVWVLLCYLFRIACCTSIDDDDFTRYLEDRRNIIEEERTMAFGAKIFLDEKESRANEILMRYKREELKKAFEDPKTFLPSKNFLHVSTTIERSRVYQTIRKMPKGGVLHAHISAINSRDFILGVANRSDCKWQLLAEARMRDKEIDKEIAEALTMYSDEGFKGEKGVDDTWKKFLSIFCFVKSLITYRPVYEHFLYHIMEELYDDNVQFMEIRTPFSTLYELDGYQHKYLQVVNIYNKVVDRFVKEHPDFFGVKWIYSPQRNVPRQTFAEHIQRFRNLKRAYPDRIVGFDLVGQEDKGPPLIHFARELMVLGNETRFYFHAGETNWYGQQTDENLIDAVLLNAKRIGHGYALIKHPKLMDLVKKKNIAIEISPISNQVLKLVKDLRNHPASYFFAENLPVVVSNDDPGFWGARALSYDFYEAFVGIMSSKADLRALKQLALNSIAYSSLNDEERNVVWGVWERRWSDFVSAILVDGR